MSGETKLETWAIVDVLGHQRYVGLVTEQVVAGTGFVRIDIPDTTRQPYWTKLIGAASIYAITPVSEAIARRLAENNHASPITPYELKTLAAPKIASTCDDDDDTDPDGWAA